MKEKTIVDLINEINHISLNNADLLDAVMDFKSIFIKSNAELSNLIEKFMELEVFVHQSLSAAREGVVLAIGAITLSGEVIFSDLVSECVNVESQRVYEDEICADDDTKKVMRLFMTGLRKEVFSRIYSQNKGFNELSLLSVDLLKNRYNLFMSREF